MSTMKANWTGRVPALLFAVALTAGAASAVQKAKAEAGASLEARNLEEDAKRAIMTLKSVVLARTMENIVCGGDGSLPDNLQQLIDDGDLAAPPSFLVDPWGNEYIYSKEGNDGELCEIYSAGPDGIPGTEDDVHAKREESPSK